MILELWNIEKKNRKLIILIIILFLLVVGLSGYIVYDKVEDKDVGNLNVDTNNDDNNNDFEREELTTEEINKLDKYINEVENNAFILMNYSNPEEMLTKNNIEISKYSINASDFFKNVYDN